MTRCYLCDAGALERLEPPRGDRSPTTGGRLLDRRLEKYQCLACSLVQSNPGRVLDAATFSYEGTYDFYSKPFMRAFERERYRAYANWVGSFIERCGPRTVLEIGCGEGWVIELLRAAYPALRWAGLEPSQRAAQRAKEAGTDVTRGDAGDHPFAREQFDFIYCINVLEHVADPLSFLQEVRRLLAPAGAALIVCPCANVIDPELLFADHLYSYSRANLERLARLSDLDATAWQQGEGALYPFQALWCSKTERTLPCEEDGRIAWWSDAALPSGRRDYLRRWAALDDVLLERLQATGDVVCFGAGETTDLLRAFASRSWTAVRECMIDRPCGAPLGATPSRSEDLAVRFTETYRGEFGGILLAVKPLYHPAISERLHVFGKPVIRWDDVIPEPFDDPRTRSRRS